MRLIPPGRKRSRQHNAARSVRLVLCLGLALPITGCAQTGPGARAPIAETGHEAEPAWGSAQQDRLNELQRSLDDAPLAPHAEGLLVRLAFDDAADLDLFVTDPLQETVYFANSPSRSGGRLVDDQRCDDPEPRLESVQFAEPPAGRYRVGVDYHVRCDNSSRSRSESKQGMFVVRVDHAGGTTWREGMVQPGQFDVIVLEFDVAERQAGE